VNFFLIELQRDQALMNASLINDEKKIRNGLLPQQKRFLPNLETQSSPLCTPPDCRDLTWLLSVPLPVNTQLQFNADASVIASAVLRPVVPLVKQMVAKSSGCGGCSL